MNKKERDGVRSAPVVPFVVCAGLVASASFAANRFQLPKGPGRGLVYGQCQTCHDLQSVVDSAGIGQGAWDAVLDNMRSFGLRIDDDQRARILDYLATYLGPNPPPSAPADTSTEETKTADGAKVFKDICSACHQAEGDGKPGEFPPLAGNSDLFLAPDYPILVVLNGLEGPITVDGETYDNVMAPLDFLSDAEVAAAVSYVRSHWGNAALAPADAHKVSASDVADARQKTMTSEEVHALRQSLLP